MKYQICILLIVLTGFIYGAESQLENLTINAPSLASSLLGESVSQQIAVYTPPGYAESDKQYPVVYFLPGYGDYVNYWTNGRYQNFRVKNSMDKLITAGTVKEMIMVVVNGWNFMGGTFYVNSPATGNWEDFVTQDVISYIDSHYRTLQSPKSRGITGHSMGAFGALNLAMLHPDLFSTVYSMSPGLFDSTGLKKCQLFKNTTFIKSFITKQQEWAQMSHADALASFKAYIAGRFSIGDWDSAFGWGYAAAFSGTASGKAPFVKYPYSLVNDELVVDSLLLANYENGFGGVKNKVHHYKSNFLLLTIGIDWGLNDEYRWIPQGCKYFCDLLTAENIPYIMNTFSGGHENKIGERIETMALPFMSANLQFAEETPVEKKESNTIGYHLKLINYPNPFNAATVFDFSTNHSGKLSLRIYNLLGQPVAVLAEGFHNQGDYSVKWNADKNPSGVYIAVLNSGNEIRSNKVILSK